METGVSLVHLSEASGCPRTPVRGPLLWFKKSGASSVLTWSLIPSGTSLNTHSLNTCFVTIP